MNIVLLGAVVLLLIICIILISFLIIKNRKSSSNKKQISTSPDEFDDYEIIDFEKVKLPFKIENMESHTLFQACYKVFESFRALDYVKKSDHDIDKIEWHSWQVSLLIGLLRTDRNFFIPNADKIFHSSIKNSTQTQVDAHIKKILRKYEQNVDIQKSRDELSNDIIWTSQEVSFIFYYMVNK